MTFRSLSQYIVGNWKIYESTEVALSLSQQLLPLFKSDKIATAWALPYSLLTSFPKEGDLPFVLGCQTIESCTPGAFAGEIAADLLKEGGAQFVVVGQSLNRILYKESHAAIHAKIDHATRHQLEVILCVGESLEQREANETEQVLKEQLTTALANLALESLEKIFIAYEPVWAEGTGCDCTTENLTVVMEVIRVILDELFGPDGKKIELFYAGPILLRTASNLLKIPGLKGLLWGGTIPSVDYIGRLVASI